MSADCMKARCESGHCRYDKTACECVDDADCDDGDPCTRNHCFARTLSCIYINVGCED